MSTADANKPKEKNLTCNMCGLVFESEQTLHEHMKKDHSQEAQPPAGVTWWVLFGGYSNYNPYYWFYRMFFLMGILEFKPK